MSKSIYYNFADDVLAAESPAQARQMVASHILENSTKQFTNSKRWPPSIFIMGGLSQFYRTIKQTGSMEFVDEVLRGYVDAAIGLDPSYYAHFASSFAYAISMGGSLLDQYSTPSDRTRMIDILMELPRPVIEGFIEHLMAPRAHTVANALMTSPIVLVDLLLRRNHDLVKHVPIESLFKELKYLNLSEKNKERTQDMLEATESVVPRVLTYAFEKGDFKLHRAGTAKNKLVDFAWAMTVLVDDAQWKPEDFKFLSAKQLSQFERAVSRAIKLGGTKGTTFPPDSSLDLIQSTIRKAALFARVKSKPDPVGPTVPKM